MNLHRNLQIAKAVVASTALAVLAGCDGTNAKEVLHAPQPLVATTYVATDAGTGAVARREVFTAPATSTTPPTPVDQTTTLATNHDGGIAFDQARNLIQVDSGGDITTFCSAANIAETPAAGTFRTLAGAAGAVNVEIAHEAGVYIVTNNTQTVSVYASNAVAGGALDTFTTTGNAWGLVYDDVADRLFVANTDGTIDIFEDFVADNFGDSGANRTLDTGLSGDDGDPDTDDPETIDDNADLRGIAYDAQQDRLVVSDIGAAEGTDGRLLIIENASSATGGGTDPGDAVTPGTDPFLVPDAIIAGASTGLGDPMALSLKGVTLRVADHATDQILLYNNIFVAGAGDVAPSATAASTDPVSVVLDPSKAFAQVNHFEGDLSSIAYVDNVNTGATQIQHQNLGEDAQGRTVLGADGNTFDTGEASVENLTFDVNGDGYVTFDDGAGNAAGSGGIHIIHRLAKGRDGDGPDGARDRTITGTTAGLAAPKGVMILGSSGYLAVAETSANGSAGPGIYVYSACQSGDTAPVETVTTSGTPWDMDYIAGTDTLYVAHTNGNVDIYAGFLSAITDGDPATDVELTLTIEVTDAAAVNLHGIHYDAGSDSIILSDVGVAGTNNDGRFWVIQDVGGLLAYAADPNTDEDDSDALTVVTLPLVVPDDTFLPVDPDETDPDYTNTAFQVLHDGTTVLGDPVDIAFHGGHLYVANKTSSAGPAILLFRNFMGVLAEDETEFEADGPDPDELPDEVCNEDGGGTCGDFIVDAQANDAEAATAPESVSLVPDSLSTAP